MPPHTEIMLEKTQIETIVFKAIEQVNEVLPAENALPAANSTLLLGNGALLDSMGFVNFIVALEDQMAQGTGLNLNIIEEMHAPRKNAIKPATVGELIDFLFAVVCEAK